jgi:hypothetical protein
MYLVSGFSLPPIKTERHDITEKLFSVARNAKKNEQRNKNPKNVT